jgi:hypothetical protein
MAAFIGDMGVSFQADNHLPGGNSDMIMVQAPQRKVA